MTIRLIYRPSYRRNSPSQLRAVNGEGSEFSETLRSAFGAEQESEAATAPSAPRQRWWSGWMEQLVLLMVRLATVAVGLAVWRIASDLDLNWWFPFSTGVASHWQVWFALGVLLSGSALMLARRLRLAHADEAARTNEAQAA
jgi:hypothetical protein